ncbi:DUF7507 domain-containing protein [Brevirhabdus sp.]|uniref:DUF7507 domain-containing protein n=1 Tax=Brevirhabdus sp. TaxID=2004514 RepID=UPI00405886B0
MRKLSETCFLRPLGNALRPFAASGLRLAIAVLAAVLCVAGVTPLAAQQLVLNTVGAPTVIGNGTGKRALWRNAGNVAGTPVDIVGVLSSTTLNHALGTGGGLMQITSAAQDPHFVDFFIYQAGTYDIGSDSGGVPVSADVHVQINDIDGPANEEVYAEICSGSIEYIRIDRSATTYRTFVPGPNSLGTELFTLVGDRNYANQPVSGLEIFYPNTSTFRFGRTANTGFLVRIANPTYDIADTFDLQCADFRTITLNDDIKEQVLGEPVTLNILYNDTLATENNIPPANDSRQPSRYAMQAIDLIAPAVAVNRVIDSAGHLVAFDVPGEGTWSYDDSTGELTFTPFVAFFAAPTPIDYRFELPDNTAGRRYSASANVAIDVGAVGLLKLATLVDTNLNGYADPGETIAYVFTAENFGNVDLTNVTLADTQFSGKGVPPVITFQAATALSPEGSLKVGEKAVYTATYTLVPDDMDTTISNQAEVTATTPGGTAVSDKSDSENPGDGDGVATNGPGPNNDDPTTIYISSGPDRGDAPATYGDPQHIDTASLWIGPVNGDGDSSPQQSATADLDDTDGIDDESEEAFPQLYGTLTRNVTIEVHEPVPGTAYLQAFVDFNADGSFLTPGDQVATDLRDGAPGDLDGVVNGQIQFPVVVPIAAPLLPTFARIRWSTSAGLDSISAAPDGEVEDYAIVIKTPPDADRGDAPVSYGDPRHVVEAPGPSTVYMGSAPPDVDLLPQPDNAAASDDLTGIDDEEGVTLPPLYAGGFADITVSVTEPAAATAFLQAFVDFDADGSFAEPSDRIARNLQDGGSLDKDGIVNGSITFEVTVPSDASALPTYARFRWSTDTTDADVAFDGEVEDYPLTISNTPPPFICDASLYRFDSGPTSLQRLTFATNGSAYDMTLQELGTTGTNLNSGWGFNELDGFFYTVRPGRRELWRVDASGTFSEIGQLPNSAARGSTSGDILPNGIMVYVDEDDSWQLVDLTVPALPTDAGTLELNRKIEPEDIAYNPVDGNLYGINQASGRVFRVSANGGAPGNVAVTEFGPAIYVGTFGSVWFDADGRFYGYSNTTNSVFLIDTVTGGAQFLSRSPTDEGGDSDAASCRGPAPFPMGGISGNLYEDSDGSDTRDGTEINLAGGIRIDLYSDNGTPANVADDTFIKTVDTLPDGTYSLSDLLTILTYRVEVDEADPDLGTDRLIGTSNPRLSVPVTDNSVTTDQDFGFDPSGADLSITKLATRSGTTTARTSVAEGDVIDWIITVTNAGPGSPSGVKVIDQIPKGFTYLSDDAPAAGDSYDPATGLWFVDEILAGTSETLVITTRVNAAGALTNRAEIIYSSLPDPDSDPGVGALVDDLSDEIVDDDEAEYAMVRVTNARRLTGRLFLDNGAGGGLAHDAQINGGERGFAGAELEILDGSGTLLDRPEVAADGTWFYGLDAGYSDTITIRATSPADHITVSEASAGLPGPADSDPHDGSITFTPEPGEAYFDLNIGLVALPGWTQDQTAEVGPGQVVLLPHLYTATTSATVTFTAADRSMTPAGGFGLGLYHDTDCDGTPDTPLDAGISVAADETLCVIARVSAGSGVGPGSRYSYAVTALTTLSATPLSDTRSNIDTVGTSEQGGQLVLRKTVRNVTKNSAEGAANGGAPGDVLHYRIYIENPSDAPISDVNIFDRTPAYTALSEPLDSPVAVTPGLTCVVSEPAPSAAGYEGPLRWTCTGQVYPGGAGLVSFQVRIAP